MMAIFERSCARATSYEQSSVEEMLAVTGHRSAAIKKSVLSQHQTPILQRRSTVVPKKGHKRLAISDIPCWMDTLALTVWLKRR